MSSKRSHSSFEHARLAVSVVRAQFDTPHVSFLVRYADGQLWPFLEFGLFRLMDGLPVPAGMGLSWAALETRRVIFSPAAANDPRAFDPVAELGPPHAQLTAPLLGRQGQPLGVIHVAVEHPRSFDQADQDWLEAQSKQVAVSLEDSLSREHSFEESLEVLSMTLDEKKRLPAGRSLKLARLVCQFADFLGEPPSVVQAAYWGSLLCHASVLERRDSSASVKNYALERFERTRQALDRFPLLMSASMQLVLHQDQRWDGHGFPGDLAGEAIPHLARMFAVCDSFLMSVEAARDPEPTLRADAGHRLDPMLVDAFLEMPDRILV